VTEEAKSRQRRIKLNLALAILIPAGTILLCSVRGMPGLAQGLLAILGFAAYVVFVRRAVLAWEPDINDLPPPPRP
jgi:hypothetical protein